MTSATLSKHANNTEIPISPQIPDELREASLKEFLIALVQTEKQSDFANMIKLCKEMNDLRFANPFPHAELVHKAVEKYFIAQKNARTVKTATVVVESAPTPSKKSIEPTPKSPSLTLDVLYAFPQGQDGSLSAIGDADLMEALHDLICGLKSADHYSEVRKRYCDISIELNERGLWAPAFRPSIKIPYIRKEHNQSHMLVHRDRLVIDCHWIHSRKMNVNPETYWRPLFRSPTFLTELAEEFATRNAASDYRTETILGLTKLQQLQLQALKGSEVTAHKKSLIKHERDKDGKLVASRLRVFTAAIDRWCELQPRIREQREKYVAHANARLLLETVATPTWREVAELGGMIQGIKPLGERTVSDFLKKLDQRIAKATPIPKA